MTWRDLENIATLPECLQKIHVFNPLYDSNSCERYSGLVISCIYGAYLQFTNDQFLHMHNHNCGIRSVCHEYNNRI